MLEIMRIIDQRETQKINKQSRKTTRGQIFSERVRAKWFCCAIKLGFPQLICKASLIFQSHMEFRI